MSKNRFSRSMKFSVTIAVITFVLAAIFSVISASLLSNLVWYSGFFIVFFIILTGIAFDILGTAPAAANEAPLHAMAAKKVIGAKEALFVVRNADRFASFCNDVIGDISGIVSGTALAVVIVNLSRIADVPNGSTSNIIISVVLTSVVASFTVGGKALSKSFAINSSTKVVLLAGKIIYFLENRFNMSITKNNKNAKKRR